MLQSGGVHTAQPDRRVLQPDSLTSRAVSTDYEVCVLFHLP